MSNLDFVLVMRAGTIFYISSCSHAACHIAVLNTGLALINTHRLTTLQSVLSPQFSFLSFLLLSYLERTSSMLRTHSQGMQLDLGEDSDFLSKDSDFSLPIRILPK